MHGKIIKGISGVYSVDIPNRGIIECKPRGIFRKKKIMPLIGDVVEVEYDDSTNTGNIVKILPRKNQLIRPTVSNVDQAIIVFATTNPEPNFLLLDQFLISIFEQDIEVIICFNKSDLNEDTKINNYASIYKSAGYEVVITSTYNNKGQDTLRNLIKGKTTVFAGPSGVGKSSILNMIEPALKLKTGDLSYKIKRGKHTTRHVELLALEDGGYVLDTPGFTSLSIEHIPYEKLMYYFKEFIPYISNCKYNDCQHINEPNCAVKDAVKEDKISNNRYENYKYIYNELKDTQKNNKWR